MDEKEAQARMNDKRNEKKHVWVTDKAGNEYLCPIDALKDPKDATQDELDNCIDVESLKQYIDV